MYGSLQATQIKEAVASLPWPREEGFLAGSHNQHHAPKPDRHPDRRAGRPAAAPPQPALTGHAGMFSQVVGTCGPIALEHDNADGSHGSRALVTGASRGLGKAFAEIRLKRSAITVYGAARAASAVTIDGGARSSWTSRNRTRSPRPPGRCADIDILTNPGVMQLRPLLSAASAARK